MNRTTMIVIGIAGAIAVGGLGFWLGQNRDATRGANETADAPAASQPPPVGRWTLEAQFEGPLKDTVVQRWRDPKTGVLCYIYLPVIVQHSNPLQNGMVHYAGNDIGTISCTNPKS